MSTTGGGRCVRGAVRADARWAVPGTPLHFLLGDRVIVPALLSLRTSFGLAWERGTAREGE